MNNRLLTVISMLKKAQKEHRVPERSTSIVIMLTDGDANYGEAGGRGSKSELQYLAAAPGSIARLLQDLRQLSPGLLRRVSPSRSGPCLPLSGLPTPGWAKSPGHDTTRAAHAGIRSLQTEWVQTVVRVVARV